jgi:hypothetical protein
MDVFLAHGRDRRVITTAPTATVSEFLAAAGVEGDVYLDDHDHPLEAGKTLDAQGVKEGTKLFAGACRRVTVTVRFAGFPEKDETFPPGAAVAAVFAWATGKKGFDLPPAERAKHTFVVCDGTEQPDMSDHIGSWNDAACKVCFGLVPKQRFEG